MVSASNPGSRQQREDIVVWVVLIVVGVAVGIGLFWLGFELGKRERLSGDAQPAATATLPAPASTLVAPAATLAPTSIPTITPLPGAAPTSLP